MSRPAGSIREFGGGVSSASVAPAVSSRNLGPPPAASTVARQAALAAGQELVSKLRERNEIEDELSAALSARDKAAFDRDEALRRRELATGERDSLLASRLVMDAKLSAMARESFEAETILGNARERASELAEAVSNAHVAAEAARQREQALALAASDVIPIGLNSVRVPDETLGCFKKANPIRRIALLFTRSRNSVNFILFNIILNFIILASTNPLKASTGLQDQIETTFEPWFQFIFAFEAILKIIAIGTSDYFSDGWCLLDFTVVVICFLVYIPGMGNASALRALRALRPLRTFGLIPSLRRTFNGILAVGRHILRVDMLEWFIILVAALVGLQIWTGSTKGACFYQNAEPPPPWAYSTTLNEAGLLSTAYTQYPGYIRNRVGNHIIVNAGTGSGFCKIGDNAYGDNKYYSESPWTTPACPAVFGVAVNQSISVAMSNITELKQSCFPANNPMQYGTGADGFSL